MDPVSEITLDEKLRFLRQPAAYECGNDEVVVEETHMSWVFLVGKRAYKLKKPVCYSYLDFSTVEARARDCREEVRLNRRLAPDVYLGVVPLTVASGGGLSIGGNGVPVDWLVVMRRLPRERMLDRALSGGHVDREEVIAVADALCDFYRGATRADISPEEYVAQFRREQEKNREVLTDTAFDLDGARIADTLCLVDDVLANDAALLMARVEAGRVVEGHGDLRPEHVCLNTPPVIIDCLEFNRELRLVDPVDELMFLGLECKRLGDGWIGATLFERYSARLGDAPPTALLDFYWRYRACLRARLSLVHILERDTRAPGKWLPLARQYLALAETPEINLPL